MKIVIGLTKREFQRKAWNAIKAFVHDKDYENIMDDMAIHCSQAQWDELGRWIEIARTVLNSSEVEEHGAAPLPLIRREVERTIN